MILWALCVVLLAHTVHGQTVPDCVDGRNVIVQYFGWKWTDIENECNIMIDPIFVCAIQVPPPFEHEKITLAGGSNPWYQRWSIVGYYYRVTDSGMDTEFDQMVRTCHAKGVRVYADLEFNHMTPDGNPGGCYGSAGSFYDGRDDPYFYLPSYSTVPWGRIDFHLAGESDGCPTGSGNVDDYTDPEQIWMCKFQFERTSYDVDGSYNDLKTSTDKYEFETVQRMDLAVDIGVYGFKISHARWMRPSHLQALIDGVKVIPDSQLKPFIYLETVDFKDGVIPASSYFSMGRVEEVMAGYYLSNMAQGLTELSDFVDWGDSAAGTFNMVDSDNAIVYVDDPNRQRGIFRDSLANTWPVISFRNPRAYVVANSLMLSHPYGMKKVFSSYDWTQDIEDGEDNNDWMGPPMTDGIVDDVIPTVDTYGCEGSWNCEHRWQAIRGMMIFENENKKTIFDDPDNYNDAITNFQNADTNQIGFVRGSPPVGFFAINNNLDEDMSVTFYTGLPAGTYCDLTTKLDLGDFTSCPDASERQITVDADGDAVVTIPANSPFPAVAILAP